MEIECCVNIIKMLFLRVNTQKSLLLENDQTRS